MAPPPFTPSPDLARLVGIPGMGLMTWLVAKAQPALDVPGGWCVGGGTRELCAELGWGPSRWNSETKALQAAGLIVIVQGMRLGRGAGSTPNRYFLAHHPDLHTPDGPVGGSRFRNIYFRDSQDRDFYSGNIQGPVDNDIHRGRHLIAAPLNSSTPHESAASVDKSALEVSEVGIPSTFDTSVVDVVLHQQQVLDVSETEIPSLPEPRTEPKAAPFTMQALRRLGWVGPPPAVADEELLAAVAIHLEQQKHRFRNPPGFLKRLIEQDTLTVFAQTEQVAASSVDDPVSQDAMPFERYTELCMASPEWERLVDVETARRAQSLGIPVTMLLKRTVALEVPLAMEQERVRQSEN